MVTRTEGRDPDQAPPVDPAWRTGAKLIALAAAIAALWLAREIVLLAFLGILIGIVLSFPVGWLARHMKRGVAVLIVVLVILGGIGGAVAVGAAKLVSQADTLRDEAQKGLRSLQEKFEQLRGGEQKRQKQKG